jgi:hypothetical protein
MALLRFPTSQAERLKLTGVLTAYGHGAKGSTNWVDGVLRSVAHPVQRFVELAADQAGPRGSAMGIAAVFSSGEMATGAK